MSYSFTITEPDISPFDDIIEVMDSTFSVGSGKATATDVWLIKPYEACVNVINSITRRVSGTGSNITIRLPLKHARVNARLVSVTVEHFSKGNIWSDETGEFIQSDAAKLTINYSSETNQSEGDTPEPEERTIIEESLKPNTRIITMPNRKLYWNNDKTNPLKNDEAPGRLIKMVDWEYTILDFPYIPAETILYPGYVNSSAVTSTRLGLTFDAGTLLFGDPTLSRVITSAGIGSWKITYTFSFLAEGWNKIPRAGYDTFQPFYDEYGVQFYIYPTTNFNNFLF